MSEQATAPRPPQITFQNSLPLNLLLTLALLPAAGQFADLDEWLRETSSLLPTAMRQELALLTGFPGGYLRFVEVVAGHTLPDDEPASLSFATWMASLEARPPAEFQAMALQALRRGLAPATVSDADLLDPQYLQTYLMAIDPGRSHAAAVPLVLHPEELKGRFLALLSQFWGQLYEPVYEQDRPLLERSVAYHRAQSYPSDFGELFLAVTGRVRPAEVQAFLPHLRRVRFTPSRYLGSHVAFFRPGEVLTVFYGVPCTMLVE